MLTWKIRQETLGGGSHNFKWNGQRRSEEMTLREEMRAWRPMGDWGMRIQVEGTTIRSVLFMIFFFNLGT